MSSKNIVTDEKNHYKSERINRRVALKRLSISTGMAVLSLLTIDDLTRMAEKRLRKIQAGDNPASESRSIGEAVASPIPGDCSECDNEYKECIKACNCPQGCDCRGGSFWPWCLPYNFCIGPYGSCAINRTLCYQERCD